MLILNAFGKDAEITGKCTLNGELLTSKIFKRHFCVVPQEDTHRAFLTCKETLRYAANFYMSTSEEEKNSEVEKILDKLGLADCADTRVGNQFLPGLSGKYSLTLLYFLFHHHHLYQLTSNLLINTLYNVLLGGQKKRLSIGLALLKRPSVLILDEPTSGLDAAASYHVMGYIRELAATLNIIVIVTIHQPASSIYLSFNKVLLLSKGATAFIGTPARSVEYFKEIGHSCPQNTNPAEFLLDIINNEFTSDEQVESILCKWEANEESELNKMKSSSSAVVQTQLPDTSQLADLSIMQQFKFVGSRQLKLVFLDPMLYAGRAVMFLMACSFFAVIYIYCRDRVQNQVLNRLWLCMCSLAFPPHLELWLYMPSMKNIKPFARKLRMVCSIYGAFSSFPSFFKFQLCSFWQFLLMLYLDLLLQTSMHRTSSR